MNNIRMAMVASLAIALLPGVMVAAQDRSITPGQKSAAGSGDFRLTMTTDAGIMYGTANEYVYDQTYYKNFILSELDWDMKPLPYAGLSLEAAHSSGLFVSASLKCGIPGKTGTMTDSDWVNEAYGYLASKDVKTNYSESTAYAERAIFGDLTLGYRAKVSRQVSLTPFLAFSVKNLKWSAHDGYYQYTASSSLPYSSYTTGSKVSFSGMVGDYEQTYLCPEAGLSLEYAITPSLSLAGSFAFSPAVTATAIDNHYLRFLQFKDVMSGGTLVEPQLSLSYSFSSRAKLSLSASYTSITGLIGSDTETVMSGADSYYVYYTVAAIYRTPNTSA